MLSRTQPLCVALAMGTRPEAIKLAPILRELRHRKNDFEVVVIATGQHRQMLDQVLNLFDIVPDIDLNLMSANQKLNMLSGRALQKMEVALAKSNADVLLVQGDTTTTLAASIAAFHLRIPIAHVEAGLRSHDLSNPFPEEGNRRVTSALASIHFAPTSLARQNLLNEKIFRKHIVVTGNTVVDSMRLLLEQPCSVVGTQLAEVPFDRSRVLVVTSHRRENFGLELENICLAVRELVSQFPDLYVVWPVHMNPNVRVPVTALLGTNDRIQLTEPLDYRTFLDLIKRSHIILTDSGGLQEEAPALGKPVLVLRRVTERPEAAQCGLAKIVGTSREVIVAETSRLLNDPAAYYSMTMGVNPYGDGHAAKRITAALLNWWRQEDVLLPPAEEFGGSTRELEFALMGKEQESVVEFANDLAA